MAEFKQDEKGVRADAFFSFFANFFVVFLCSFPK
jgi:hypothetical protein